MVASGRRLCFDNHFFYCVAEVIISAVHEDSTLPKLRMVVSSLAPSLFCLSAASLDRWPQSVLLFHLDPKHSKPLFLWVPAQDLFESFYKVF